MSAAGTARKFEAAPAVLDGIPVWLGVGGPSGSGKTYTALRMATGMQRVVGGDIYFIDTENKRAKSYANEFKFFHVPFEPPFSSLGYLDAARFCAKRGAKVIVIDSMSHEHEGEGGYLQSQEARLDEAVKRAQSREYERRSEWELREAMKFSAWIRPAAERTAMVQGLLQLDALFVFCFRAKEKIALQKKGGNKKGNDVVSLGWQPIAGAELVYNCTAMLILPPRSAGVPSWDSQATKINGHQHRRFFPSEDDKPITEETGQLFARWAGHGSKDPAGDGGSGQASSSQATRPDPQQRQQGARQGTAQSEAPTTTQQEDLLGGGGEAAAAPSQGADAIPATGLPDGFKNAGEFIQFSKRYLDGADPIDAEAWEAKYPKQMATLRERSEDAWSDLMERLRVAKAKTPG